MKNIRNVLFAMCVAGGGILAVSAGPASALAGPHSQAATQAAAPARPAGNGQHRSGMGGGQNMQRCNGWAENCRHGDGRRVGNGQNMRRCNGWAGNCWRGGNRRFGWGGGWGYYGNPGYYGRPAVGLVIGSGYGDYYPSYGYPSAGSAHVRWCENRYRSYNPRNNTWISYSGEVRRCISPYS